MAKNLVIVESPAKSKTIKKYLGNDFEILASYGHVREIPSKEDSIDVDKNFKIKFVTSASSKKQIDTIKKAVKTAENIYLATDPDREGEAISWHLKEILKNSRLLTDKNVYRVAFNEITKTAVKNAIAHPGDINESLVKAQQARQSLDFLVGFKLSPLLWRKITSGLSAGRVQSPALRLVVEREQEIISFIKKDYWSITANLHAKRNFSATLTHYNQHKLEQFTFENEKQSSEALATVEKDANGSLIVDKVTQKKSRRNPTAPFITSTLQQEAFSTLGFNTTKTMMVAQKLYEGLEVGSEGLVGLITYMRTDSVSLSNDAINDIRNFIDEKYGKQMLPVKPRVFKTKSQNAQEAHEAIRVTSAFKTPESIEKYLTRDQFRLYSLVWRRTVASQMKHASVDNTAVELKTKNQQHTFRATGSVIVDKGFLEIYTVKTKDDILPALKEGDNVNVKDIILKAHTTEPPPRYSEASLVKALEKHGIGRPSTYASIISTLKKREYVIIDAKRLKPTDKGEVVNKFLTQYFNKYVRYSYTAALEEKLDEIAIDKNDYLNVLNEFYHPFIGKIAQISKDVQRKDVVSEELEDKCPKCSSPLVMRLGRGGKFIGCSNYPECKFTKQVNGDDKEEVELEVVKDRKCDKCGSDLHIKQGRYGKFIGCSNYPECKHMEPLYKPRDTGVQCPKCNKNNIVEKKTRKGKLFYACSGFPKCKNAYWYPPIKEECPKCKSPILLHKTTKKYGEQKACPNPECDYALEWGS